MGYSIASSNWTAVNSTKTNNAALAPDGTLVASFTNTPSVNSSFTIPMVGSALSNSTAYTYFVHAKILSSTNVSAHKLFLEINLGGTNGVTRANFDLFSLVATKSTPLTAAYIEDAGDGWYKCIVNFTTDATGAAGLQTCYIGGYGSTPETVTVALWGAQLEPGSVATSLIVTTTGVVSRNAEFSSILTDASWFNAKEGTIIVDAIFPPNGTSVNQGVISLAAGNNAGERIDLRVNNSLVSTGAVNQATLYPGFTAGSLNRYAMSYKAGKFSISRNGAAVLTASPASIPVATQISIGGVDGGAGNGRVWIPRLTYYPFQFADSVLQFSSQL